jgi:hypothetical protein
MNAITCCLVSLLAAAGCASVPEARSPLAADAITEAGPSATAVSTVERHMGSMRFAGTGAPGYAVARREKNAIAIWAEGSDGNQLGDTTRVAARHVIGDVSLAVSGDSALVVWAQGEPSGCTSLFGLVWRLGESPSEARRLASPCTEENSARAPRAVGADNGRFVVLYTDLGVWSSSLVSLTVDQNAQRIGAPFVQRAN